MEQEVIKRIREYITTGVIKTEGIRKLQKEFKLDKNLLCDMWLVERHKLQPSIHKGKMSIVPEYTWLKLSVRRSDVDKVKEFVKSL